MAFPVVPIAPGVPPLVRDPSVPALLLPEFIDQDETSGFGAGLRPQWGIYLGGQNVVAADTVTAFDFKAEEVIADYPLERGSFESFNKVARPYEARVQFARGGSESDRAQFLQSIAAILPTLEFYSVVSPEVVYRRGNVARWDYRRTTTNGVGLILVDVLLQEVRVQNSGTLSNTNAPSGADPAHGGTVDPIAPTATQAEATAT